MSKNNWDEFAFNCQSEYFLESFRCKTNLFLLISQGNEKFIYIPGIFYNCIILKYLYGHWAINTYPTKTKKAKQFFQM